ncbi:sensor histidine kinase [Marinilactibacillus kalidii]|uniref:sensor histidine kinase n=1 Tax=Marinilactibacillus kalidii TaxID=2820274 RepID=UPI001ABE1120|nr:HAMP domain-containing sensor histidine kinase [Marinilactibacillus kalidii]
MFFLLIISIIVNMMFLLKFYQDRKFNKRLMNQLEWVISGKAMSDLKKNASSKSQDELVNKINELISRLRTMKIDYTEIDEQNKQMIASISHDFRTPLTSMLGYVQILQGTAQQENEVKFLKIIEDRTTVLSELVEEFYRLSLLDSKEHHLQFVAASPVLMMQEQIAMYHQELSETFDHVNIQLINEATTVSTSKLEFSRLIGNLIKNAFTHGYKRFSIYNEMSEDTMMIYIENEVAHPESIDISRLFDRTYKGDQARQAVSTGLGLSIAKKIAEVLAYKLEANLYDQVLQFKLTIPIDDKKKELEESS